MRHIQRLFFPALVMTGIPAGQASLAGTLSQEQIAHQIIGKDLTATHLGMTVHLRYNSDGSITMKTPFISGSGTWVYSEDGLCMTMTKGPKRGKTCTSFEALEDGSYRNSEGQLLQVQQ